MVDLEEWLREDDAKSRPFRAQRAREMMAACPIDEAGVMVSGGEDTMTAFVEARLAYVNGLYLCTVLSALAVLERHFTARLYGAGLESAKRIRVERPQPPAMGITGPGQAEEPLIGTDHTGTAEPQCGYREDCDIGGLEHRALIRWSCFSSVCRRSQSAPGQGSNCSASSMTERFARSSWYYC